MVFFFKKKKNFDELLVPADHVSRSVNDTYYINETHVLRCHTSAHQAELVNLFFDFVFSLIFHTKNVNTCGIDSEWW